MYFADIPGQDLVVGALPPLDSDGDGFANPLDNCPFFAQQSLADTDGDGRGDACECTDQDGDGRNTVSDLVEINRAMFTPSISLSALRHTPPTAGRSRDMLSNNPVNGDIG